MNAIVYVLALAVVALALAYVSLRRWRSHRAHPGALRERARSWWQRLGRGGGGAHWSPGGYLTAHVIVGLLVIIAGIAIFAQLADWIVDQSAVIRFDVRADEYLHAHATPLGVQIARAVSFVGGPAAMAFLMVAGAVYLLVRRERLLLYGWLLAFIGGGALDWALKTMFHRARPVFPDAVVHVMGYSFPSGHAMGSLIGFGMLAYLLIHELRRSGADVLVATLAGILALAVGLSRLYLGVHYPSDVLAGFAAGIAWLAATISALEASAPVGQPD